MNANALNELLALEPNFESAIKMARLLVNSAKLQHPQEWEEMDSKLLDESEFSLTDALYALNDAVYVIESQEESNAPTNSNQ